MTRRPAAAVEMVRAPQDFVGGIAVALLALWTASDLRGRMHGFTFPELRRDELMLIIVNLPQAGIWMRCSGCRIG